MVEGRLYLSSHLRILQVGLRIAGGKLGDLPDLYTVSVCLHTDASTRIEALRDTCNALWLHSSMQRWVNRKPLQTLFYIIHASNQILPQRLALKAAASSVPETKNGVIRMMFVAGHCGSFRGSPWRDPRLLLQNALWQAARKVCS